MIRLRQVCLVASDRDTVVSHIESVFSLRTAYEDPGVATFGLHNAVIPVGDQFLEIVAPVRFDPEAAFKRKAPPGGARRHHRRPLPGAPRW